jgi:hypothetical protein
MYRCTPSQLAKEKGEHLFEMFRDMKCSSMIAKVENQRRKLKQ